MIFFARLVPADLIGEERSDRTPVASCSSVVELADRSLLRVHALILESVQPARLQLALLDPQVAREFRRSSPRTSSMKRSAFARRTNVSNGVAERVIGAGAEVVDRVDNH